MRVNTEVRLKKLVLSPGLSLVLGSGSALVFSDDSEKPCPGSSTSFSFSRILPTKHFLVGSAQSQSQLPVRSTEGERISRFHNSLE